MVKTTAVIGAGITGMLAAYYLAKAGHSVAVFDQEPYVAMKTSYANGGQISVSNSEVWTTWANVKKGAKWMMKKDAPLLIRPGLDLAKLMWISKFLWNTANNRYEENTISTIKMGLESRNLYKQLISEESLEFDQSDCGILHIYKDQEYFDHAKKSQDIYVNNGCEWDILTPLKVSSLDPALHYFRDVIGGAWTPSDWTGDIHKFCKELKTVLETRYNVEFFFNCSIESSNIEELYEDYDNVVVSAGVGSVKIANYFGDSLDIYPVKGYSITVNVSPDQIQYLPKVSILDDQAKIVTSTLGNRFRVAGTAELTGENYDIRKDRIDPLLKWVHHHFPTLDTSSYSSWACLRPMTPNMLPIVKKSKTQGVYYHTGHGHLGWTLSPATAQHLCAIIT